MTTNNIAINFLEITPSQFNIKYYRKEIDFIPEEDRNNYLQLDFKDSNDQTIKYAVNFISNGEFQEQIINSKNNIKIALNYLYSIFNNLFSNNRIYPNKSTDDKYKRIYLPVQDHHEGTETIWLEPYYLKAMKSFGLLIDYKFIVNDDYILIRNVMNGWYLCLKRTPYFCF